MAVPRLWLPTIIHLQLMPHLLTGNSLEEHLVRQPLKIQLLLIPIQAQMVWYKQLVIARVHLVRPSQIL